MAFPARIRLTVFLAAAACIAYLCRTSLAVAEKTIRDELGMSESMMGFLLGPAFFWPYALAQIPGGWIGDRIGARRMLPLLSAVWSLAAICMATARGSILLLWGRIQGGLAQAGLFPCSASALSRWHPPVERALASGALGAAMSVGAAGGAALTGELLGFMSWRTIFAVYALPGVLWSVAFYYWFRNNPEDHPQVSDKELHWIRGESARDLSAAKPATPDKPVNAEAPRIDWAKLAGSPTMWQICSQQFFRAAGYAFFTSWFATYLQETRGVSTAKSGWLLTIPLLATVFASLTGGALSDAIYRRTGRLWLARSALASTALLICATLVLMAWFVQDATLATLLIGAGAFFAALAGPCAYASTMDLGGKHVTPVFASMNMIGNFGAGLIPWLVPTFRSWVESVPFLIKLAHGNSWNAVLLLFGSMYVLAAVSWFGMRLDRPLQLDAE